MSEAKYYVKKVRRDDGGRAQKFKTSKELEAKPEKVKKRKKVMKDVRKGRVVKVAYLEDGRWKEGGALTVHKGKDKKWLRTDGNEKSADNLGEMRTF